MNARTGIPLGIFEGMASEKYHSIPALGSSGLKKLARTPQHFYGAALDPNRPPNDPTPAMKAGTLAHCALLEPASLPERYVVRPEWLDGRTKEGKAWLAAVPQGVEAVTAEQMLTAQRQAAAVRALPEIAAFLARGRAEVSAFWVDEESGVHCKCRPDWVHSTEVGDVLLDLKTTQDASPEAFAKSIARLGYHLQDAHYRDGWEQATGRTVLGLVFVVVEADYPHAAAAYVLDDASVAKARTEIRGLLDVYATCSTSGQWPGYPNTIQPISLPAWAA